MVVREVPGCDKVVRMGTKLGQGKDVLTVCLIPGPGQAAVHLVYLHTHLYWAGHDMLHHPS